MSLILKWLRFSIAKSGNVGSISNGDKGKAPEPEELVPPGTSTSGWDRTLFLHTGWTSRYDGSETPEGGHAYLKEAVGVETANFVSNDGWCYGYAPVSRTSEGRRLKRIPESNRTIKIEKLGAPRNAEEIVGVTIVWTARHPSKGPVIVGLYDNAIVYRYMPSLTPGRRPFIARARAEDCHLVPEDRRAFLVTQKQKGFPGMAAAWFPGLHQTGPASGLLAAAASYLPEIRRYSFTGEMTRSGD